MPKYILAHRGVIGDGVENTFESLNNIKKYLNDKIVYGIEFDIQEISTGDIVCYHDKDLERLHDNISKICDLTSEDILKYDIPYLSEVIEQFIDTNYLLDVEIKSYNLDNDKKEQISKKAVNLIIEKKLRNNCIISSFDPEIIKYLLTNYPEIESYLLIKNELDENILNNFINIGMKGIAINKEQYLKVGEYISKGLSVAIYTFFNKKDSNDIYIMEYLSQFNDLIYITDNVDKCINFL